MPNAKIMTPEPLTQEAFNQFGDVIEAADDRNHFTINSGNTERFHELAKVETLGEQSQAIISIFRSTPLPCNATGHIELHGMERHPQGSQAFMPLSQEPYLVVVAPKGELDEGAIRVFLAKPNQGVNYATGTWHHFCLALNATSDFLVVDRTGEGNNCDEVILKTPLVISISEEQTR